MVNKPKRLQLWLRSFCSESVLSPKHVMSLFDQSQIEARVIQGDNAKGPGIVILSEITPEICNKVRKLSKDGAERVLVLVANEKALENGCGWQILQAGTSDVLVWDDLLKLDPGNIVVTRFQRWLEVDELVSSPLVKNNLVGGSAAWKLAIQRIVEVSRFTSSPVLLMGETGTGKELAARLIHTIDQQRKAGELVILDCTTIVPELSGSELFGHERGAFTGAIAARDGAFALADGGTLFLDEVGELPFQLQTQLLRVLQEHTYKRVGSNTWHRTDFRLICATNRDLGVEETQGRFRRDLYHRIAAWTIRLPPLKDRAEDIIPLARHFMEQARPGQTPPPLDERVSSYLLTRGFPGNVRDLKNLVDRIMARYVGVGPITLGDIPAEERPENSPNSESWCDQYVEEAVCRAINCGVGLREIRRRVEEVAIRIAVGDEGGNLQRAAKKLGVTDRALQKRLAGSPQQLRFGKLDTVKPELSQGSQSDV